MRVRILIAGVAFGLGLLAGTRLAPVPEAEPAPARTTRPDLRVLLSTLETVVRRLDNLEGVLVRAPGLVAEDVTSRLPVRVVSGTPREPTRGDLAAVGSSCRDELLELTRGQKPWSVRREVPDEVFFMSPWEALERFGRPDRISVVDGYENWHYQVEDGRGGGRHVTLVFVGGRLVQMVG